MRYNAMVKRKKPYYVEHFFRAHVKHMIFALKEVFKQPLGNLLTLSVIAVALTLPATLYTIAKNVSVVASGLQISSELNLYLKNGTPEARVMVMKDKLESWPEVKSVHYISSQQGLQELSHFAGLESALSLLSSNPLPAILIVIPQASYEQTSVLRTLVKKLKSQPDVSDIRLDENWHQRLAAIRHLASTLSFILGFLMLTAVFLIISNTLQFKVLSHKAEIQVMKLIGATDDYILRPYLYLGVWLGLLGSFSAWLITTIIIWLLNYAVKPLAKLYDSSFELTIFNWDENLLLLMLGCSIGYIAAKSAAVKHLKTMSPP